MIFIVDEHWQQLCSRLMSHNVLCKDCMSVLNVSHLDSVVIDYWSDVVVYLVRVAGDSGFFICVAHC